jgi:hypothetical protein
MYVVSAKITCFPLKLSSSQSNYQHGHCGISETSGVFDEERSSYFLRAPSASGAPINTCKPRSYMYVVSARITCLPLKLSPSQSYYQHGYYDTSESRGVFDEERSSYFLHVPSASGALFNTTKPRHLYVRCECKNNLVALKVVFFS